MKNVKLIIIIIFRTSVQFQFTSEIINPDENIVIDNMFEYHAGVFSSEVSTATSTALPPPRDCTTKQSGN